MNSDRMGQKILQSVSIVVERAIKTAGYDKTVQATVVSCADESIGKYSVRYQGGIWYAFASSPDISYRENDNVYVLVPNGDMDKQKTILGTTDQLGTNFVSITEDRDHYNQIGDNLIQFRSGYNGLYGLISRKRISNSQNSYSYQDSSIVLYEYGGTNNHIAQSPNRINNYLKNADNFLLSMDIQTDFADSQIGVGNYGLKVELTFNDNETGNEIIREYILDTQDMVGDRYNYLIPTEQSAIFNFDKENFVRVNKISLFTEGFNSYSTEEDIFISNLQFIALQALTEEEQQGTSFKINFPKGFLFNGSADTFTAQAHFRVQMKEVDIKNQNLKFYWFRQNPRIFPQHNTYSSYAGAGWTCLNPIASTDSTQKLKEKFKQFVPKNILEVTGDTVKGEECHFKCVAVYNGQVFSKDFVFKQLQPLYKFSIQSTKGFEFANDIGSTELKCIFNNNTTPTNIKYQWCKYNSQGKYQAISNSTNASITVQVKNITKFATYKCAIYDSNWGFLAAAAVKLINKVGTEGTYSIILNNADAMYVYNENGVAPTNQSMEKPQQISILSLIVYNDKGEEIPAKVLTSSKTQLQWHIPKTDTLIKINPQYEGFKNKISEVVLKVNSKGQTIESQYLIKNVVEIPYTIEDRYDIRKNKNTINVKIVYAGRVLTAFTNFTFIKQGQPGTNGTDMQIRLVPHVPQGVSNAVFNRTYPTVRIGNGIKTVNWTYSTTQDSRVTGSWFDVQMFLSGSQVFNGYKDGQDSTGASVKVLWSMLRTTGSEWIHSDLVKVSTIIGKLSTLINKKTEDDIHLSQNEISYLNNLQKTQQELKTIHNDASKGRVSQAYIDALRAIRFPYFYIDNFQTNFRDKYTTFFNSSVANGKNVNFPPVHILKAEITRDGKKYFAEMPLISMIYLTDDTNYKAQLNLDSGFRYVIYDADGTHPSYNNNDPFEINVTNITNETVTYRYFISGNLTIPKNGISKNKIQLTPKNLYDGSVLNNALMVEISINNTPKLFLHIPIHFMLNKYGQAALNDWDGVSIKINDEEDAYILTPQIGAGEKGIDNSFTGIMMGKVYTSGTGSKTGLFGYSQGRESIFLNADDGSASFGLPAAGQIKIQPGEDTAYIQGGDYIEKTNNQKGSGMKMNLSSGNAGPWIKFGSGNFQVNNEGHLIAKGGGQIANWDINEQGYLSSKDNTVGISSGDAKTGNIYITTLEDKKDDKNNIIKDDKGNPIKVRKTKTETKSLAFWAGKTQDNRINVLITHDGYLSVRQATIGTGSANNRIYIAGPDDPNQSAIFTGGHVNFSDTANGFYLGTDGLSLAETFSVSKAGYLKAKKGEIANWFINDSSLYTEGNSNYFEKATNKRNGMYFGEKGIGIRDKFWVDISQQNAYFKGQIQTDSGKIGNWTINNEALFTGDFDTKNTMYFGKSGLSLSDTFKVTKDGKLTSSSGQIANWYITSQSLIWIEDDANATTSNLVSLKNNGVIISSKDTNTQALIDSSIYFGKYGLRSSNNFYVDTKGKLVANDAKIKGKIIADSGSFAGYWTIGEKKITHGGSEVIFGQQNGLYFGEDGLSIHNTFKVTSLGELEATSAIVQGKIIANQGKIGNWSISNTSLTTRQGFKDNLTKGIVKKLKDYYYLKALNNLQKTTEWKNAKTDEEKKTLWNEWQKNKIPEEQKLTREESAFLDELDENNKEYLKVFKNKITGRTCVEYINALKEVIDPIYYMEKDSTGATTYTVPSDDDIYLGENGIRVGNLFYVLPDLAQGTKGAVLGAAKIGPWIFTGKSIRTRVTGVSKEKIIDQDHVFVQKTSDNDGFITKVDDDTNNNYVLQQGCYFGQEGIRIGDTFYVDIESDDKSRKIKEYSILYDKLTVYIQTWNKNKTLSLSELSNKIYKENKQNYLYATDFDQIEKDDPELKKYQNYYQQKTGRVNIYYQNRILKVIEDLNNEVMSKLYLKGSIKSTNGQIGNWRIGSDHIAWIDNNPIINGKESPGYASKKRWAALENNPIENQLNGSLTSDFVKNSIYFGKYGLRIGDYFYIKASKNIKDGKNDSLAYFAGRIQAEQGYIANWGIYKNNISWLDYNKGYSEAKKLKNDIESYQEIRKNKVTTQSYQYLRGDTTAKLENWEEKIVEKSIYFGQQGLRIGNGFQATPDGQAFFKGRIESGSGHIAKWQIDDNSIQSQDGKIKLNANGNGSIQIGKVVLSPTDGGATASSGLQISDGTLAGTTHIGTGSSQRTLGGYVKDLITDYLLINNAIVAGSGTIKQPTLTGGTASADGTKFTGQVNFTKAVNFTEGADLILNKGSMISMHGSIYVDGKSAPSGTIKFSEGGEIQVTKGLITKVTPASNKGDISESTV